MPQSFIVHLRGVTYPNDDGSSRQTAIAKCVIGERLVLRAEPHNPHDRHAVAVFNVSGAQLGYLPSDARDSSTILRGEPIEARVLRIIGGPRWWHRLFGIDRSFGMLVRLTKAEPDWKQFAAHRDKATALDHEVDAALAVEKAGRRDEAISLYAVVLAKIERLNIEDTTSSAHRYRSAPINRLSLLLERAGRKEEALAAIERWQATHDPIGLGVADAEAVAKRVVRLRRSIRRAP